MALAEVFEAVAGPDAPVEFTAYDGSRAGTPGSPVKITVCSPMAVAYLAQAPGALGLARAYVAGHLDVDGDMYQALTRMTQAQSISIGLAEKLRLLQALGGPKLLLHRMPPPQEVRQHRRWLAGARHSRGRDANAISHHYDVSNRFYEWVLGPSMAYTCACYPHQDATLEQAQANKFDLVARKLGLTAGMRLLDVGCGWGGMVMHAAREYGARALGVTLSAQQAAWAQAAIEHLISHMHDAGFEVRHEENLREHYARTLAAWCANPDAHWNRAVAEVGPGTARVWRLYMAGSRLGFDRNHIQLHQVLGVRLAADGTSGMPLRPDWEQPRVLAG
jgi:Mycolic acid cyclopropane synthetase